jgi:aerobic carbon-monoxide dehydrogenase large subunit
MAQLGMSQPVRRKEDIRLVTGAGRFTDDIRPSGTAYAAFVRSPHPHAKIGTIEISAAGRLPGVLAIYTAADIAEAGLGTISFGLAAFFLNKDGSPAFNPGRPLLATGRAKQLGDAVAMVVAETVAQAKDAVELIEVEYEPLPAVFEPAEAVKPGAPTLWEQKSDNIALDWEAGNRPGVEAGFARAAKIVAVDLPVHRIALATMEPRSVVAEYDKASGRYTIYLGTQGVHEMRDITAKALGVAPDRVRVITPDVGGSFGLKGLHFQEHSLVAWAAGQLGRPVKWTAERQEAFLSDTMGREMQVRAELALDADARFLALRMTAFANLGAYCSQYSILPTVSGYGLMTGPYAIPAAYAKVLAVFTNTIWVDAYRGAGRPEICYVLERLVDIAAREVGLEPGEIRRRNLVPAAAIPYKTALRAEYDSGDFPGLFAKALRRAGFDEFPARRATSRQRGKLRGLGLSYHLGGSATFPTEQADIRFLPDGRVFMGVGTGPSGQSHETAFAQILVERLGIPFDKIDFVYGDSDLLSHGAGTAGAKSLTMAGTALLDAAEKIEKKGYLLAAHFLEAAEADIEFREGSFTIAGTDRGIDILSLAERTRTANNLPVDLPRSLDDIGKTTTNSSTYPNGCHVCELEIDEETGAIELCSYLALDDFGNMVNPLIVAGQVHGGVVQGVGQALLEQIHFDAAGQLLTGSFMDYAMPRADNFSFIDSEYCPVPCKTNSLGVKGASEAGTTGSMGAAMNAVMDALAPLGVRHLDMPATPLRVWQAIQQAKVQ